MSTLLDQGGGYRITYDEDGDGRSILKYSGDMQGLVDACAKEARARREVRKPISDKSSNMRKMLSLHPLVAMKIAHEHGIPYWDMDAIFKVASGRDYSKLRTVEDKRYFSRRGATIIRV